MVYYSILAAAITVEAASSVVLALPVSGFPSNDLWSAVVPPITDMPWTTGMPIPPPAQGQSLSVAHETQISEDFLQNQELDDLFSEVHHAHDNAKVELEMDSEKLLYGGGEQLPHPRYGTSEILEGMTVEAKDQITSIFDDTERREGLPLVHTKRGREDTMSCSSAKTYLDSLDPDIKNIMAILFKDWSLEARGAWIKCDRQWDPFLKTNIGRKMKKMGREYPKFEFEKFVHAFLVVKAAS
ncbi:hypothetical protein HHX47_DHR2000618 [Lentinula edodes]|nr:hypothetical protein HHX47_DHR2000618 [Lentinula edodes]